MPAYTTIYRHNIEHQPKEEEAAVFWVRNSYQSLEVKETYSMFRRISIIHHRYNVIKVFN